MAAPCFLRSGPRLFGTLSLILAAPMTLPLAVVTLHARGELQDAVVGTLVQGADLVSLTLEEQLEGTKRYVESHARRKLLVQGMADRDLHLVREGLLAALALHPELSRAFVTDVHGTVLASHPDDVATIGRNLADQTWFLGATARPGAFVSEPTRRSADDRPWYVSVACDMADERGEAPRGYLVVEWDLSDLDERLGALRPMPHSQVLLVGTGGKVLHAGGALPLESAAARAALQAAGSEHAEVGGILAVARPLALPGWYVVVERSMDSALEPVRAVTRTVLLAFGVILGGLFVVSGYWSRTIRRYDAGQRASLEALRMSQATLARSNEELERRVTERTAELHAAAEHLERAAAERGALLEAAQDAQARAEDASRLKDEFLAVVSHELRTPLTPILAWTHLLRARRDEATFDKGLAAIERNARAQAHLVDDLLDVSRIVSGKLAMVMRPLDLADVAAQAIETARPAASGKSIDLVQDLRPTVVRGDPDRLRQVAWNLLTNAVKFTPRGGRIEVRVAREGSEAVLRVIDTGEGLEQKFLPRLFGRFSQGDAGVSRAYGGLGLGLAICRHLVEAHGGSIAADSPGKGQGATFVVRLPLSPLSAAPAPEELEATAPSLAGLRVLVVEDEPDSREVISAALTSAGAEVVAASGGEAALGLLAASAASAADGGAGDVFDVLVSDIGLPEVDGLTLLRALRDQGDATPAVALTAYARADDRRRCLAAGFQEHLAKPVDPRRLVRVVARTVHREG